MQGTRAVSEEELLLTLHEAEAFLRVSRTTMYRLMASGRLVGYKVGRKWVFYKNDLKALVQRHGRDAVAKMGREGWAVDSASVVCN